jgi:hypothetical protein
MQVFPRVFPNPVMQSIPHIGWLEALGEGPTCNACPAPRTIVHAEAPKRKRAKSRQKQDVAARLAAIVDAEPPQQSHPIW